MGEGTGSWAMIDWNWAGFRMEESRRYSSSVRMVLRERLVPALSAIFGEGKEGGRVEGGRVEWDGVWVGGMRAEYMAGLEGRENDVGCQACWDVIGQVDAATRSCGGPHHLVTSCFL